MVLVKHGTVLVWYGMAWHDMVWHGMRQGRDDWPERPPGSGNAPPET